MALKRSALISTLLAGASLGLAGCGSSSEPGGPDTAASAPARHAGALDVGVTDARLGDAITDTSGGGLRELSKGGPVDAAALRRAPNLREGVGAGDACSNAALQPDRSNLATVAEATFCLLNGERADRGLAALRFNDRLQRAALAHGNDMIRHLYFSHSGRDGSQPSERIRASGYLSNGAGWRVGENLAWGTGDLASPKAIMAAWMNSAGHRANILQPAYREVGFGVLAGNPASRDSGGATFVTEFGFIDRAVRTAAGRSGSTAARRAAARARERRAAARRTRSRIRRARPAPVPPALAPRSPRAPAAAASSASRSSAAPRARRLRAALRRRTLGFEPAVSQGSPPWSPPPSPPGCSWSPTAPRPRPA